MAETTEYPARSRIVYVLRPFHQTLLHGLPNYHRVETLAAWEYHLEFVRIERGRAAVIYEALRSASRQIGWRVVRGGPSALLPGAALLLAGLGTFLLTLSPVNRSHLIGNGLISLASLFLGTVLVTHPRVQPRTPLGIGCALSSVALAYYSISVAMDIWYRSDWLIVIGAALISIGCGTVAAGAIPRMRHSSESCRTWGFGTSAFGAGAIAAAEISWLLDWAGILVFSAKSLAALATLAIAFTAWRIREVPQVAEGDYEILVESDSAS